jgi:hypothetical protein
MNAGRILRGAGLDTDELRIAVAPIDPDKINVWPASRWLRKFWRKGVKGVTIGNWILVDPELLKNGGAPLARLVVHELVHVRQFSDAGYPNFMFRYVRDYWMGRRSGLGPREAYLAIPAEAEARRITKTIA